MKGMRLKGKISKQLENEMDTCDPLSWCHSLFYHQLRLGESLSMGEDIRRVGLTDRGGTHL